MVEQIECDASALPYAVESILIEGGVLPQDAKFFTADAFVQNIYVGSIMQFKIRLLLQKHW